MHVGCGCRPCGCAAEGSTRRAGTAALTGTRQALVAIRKRTAARLAVESELRRTYISVALLANRFDVLWVMRQVGHADSKMTMDVYAQLQQRAERQHGEAFDSLVRRARERLYGTSAHGGAAPIGDDFAQQRDTG